MIFWIIGGALASVILGVVIGYRYMVWVNGNVFQGMYDSGIIVIATEDGWDGTDEAWRSIALMVRR
jgi:hypothetical protein